MVERSPEEAGVGGPIPSRGTKESPSYFLGGFRGEILEKLMMLVGISSSLGPIIFTTGRGDSPCFERGGGGVFSDLFVFCAALGRSIIFAILFFLLY